MNLKWLNIKSKIFLLNLVVILLWFILGFITFDLVQKIKDQQELERNLSTLNHLVADENVMVQELLGKASDYGPSFSSGEMNLNRRFQLTSTALLNQLNLISMHPDLGDQAWLKKKTDFLIENTYALRELYQDLYSLLEERGSENDGLIGNIILVLNRSVQDVDIKQQLTGRFNDYLLSGNAAYLKYMEQIVDQNEQTFGPARLIQEQPEVGPSNVPSFLLDMLERLDRIDMQMGRTSKEGLRGDLETQRSILETEVVSLNNLIHIESDNLLDRRKRGIIFILAVGILGVLAIAVVLSVTCKNMLSKLSGYINRLSRGAFPEEIAFRNEDELQEISAQLHRFVGNLKWKTAFADSITEGKHDIEYEPISEEDKLGHSLLALSEKLQQAQREDEKHQQENERRRWMNEGLASFGEITRLYSNDLKGLSDQMIQKLVKYLNCSFGGLFLYDDSDPEDPVLNMTTGFAYDRKKHIARTVALGEGLIGTCAMEKERILLTDIPEDYPDIISGMGSAKPASILILPVQTKDELLGVIELSSLNMMQTHEIEFAEKIAGMLAGSITIVKINDKTAELLIQTQQQSREMQEQEGKLKEQMEKLRETEQQAKMREKEIGHWVEAINDALLVAEFRIDGVLLEMNDKYMLLLETQKDLLLGKKHHEIFGLNRHSEEYRTFWDDLSKGRPIYKEEKIHLFHGGEVWLDQAYIPLPGKDGQISRVLNIARDISLLKETQDRLEQREREVNKRSAEIESLEEAVNASLLKCEFNDLGVFSHVNENFIRITGYSEKELLGKNNRLFLKEDEKEQFNRIWDQVMRDKPYTGVMKRTRPTGEEVWLMSTFTPVKDQEGKIYKVIYLGQDITEKRLKYKLLEEANREIERLRDLINKR